MLIYLKSLCEDEGKYQNYHDKHDNFFNSIIIIICIFFMLYTNNYMYIFYAIYQ